MTPFKADEPVKSVKTEPKPEKAKETPEAPLQKTVIMSELDSYLHEKIKAQPESIEEIKVKQIESDPSGYTRLSLPEYFEKISYDCTRGNRCRYHKKSPNGEVLNRGKFVLRWIMKTKRALDEATSVRGWTFANRRYFSDAPAVLFSSSGGVEVGDAVLAFMPVEAALKLREAPGKRSRELVESRMTPLKGRSDRVLMTGNPESEHVYSPDLSAEESETGEASGAIPGSFQEGRDF